MNYLYGIDLDTLGTLGSAKAQAPTGIFDKFNVFAGSPQFGAALAGAQLAKGIFDTWNSYNQGKKALKMQEKQINMLENQLQTTNKRYEEREKERKQANAQIAASASVWDRQ